MSNNVHSHLWGVGHKHKSANIVPNSHRHEKRFRVLWGMIFFPVWREQKPLTNKPFQGKVICKKTLELDTKNPKIHWQSGSGRCQPDSPVLKTGTVVLKTHCTCCNSQPANNETALVTVFPCAASGSLWAVLVASLEAVGRGTAAVLECSCCIEGGFDFRTACA